MKRIIASIGALFLCISALVGQDVQFRASAPKAVESGRQFTLEFISNKKGSNLRLPEVEGLMLLAGPHTSQQFSSHTVNGKTTRSEEYKYTYVLMAEKEGEYTIGSASIEIDGKQYTSNTLTIKAVKGEEPAGNQGAGQADSQGSRQESSSSLNEENLFLRAEVSRNPLYLGESLVLTLRVYTRLSLQGFGDSKMPSFNGFLAEEVPLGQPAMEQVEYNGRIYSSAVIYQRILFPQHTGEITIDPFELECVVRQRVGRRSNDIFDMMFSNIQDVRVVRKTRPITITVNPLPAQGKPATFGGLVGTLSMSTSLSADTLRANDALTYKVTFRGFGNMKLMDAPKISFPHDFEVYDPKVTRDIKTANGSTSGTVTYEYLVIPRYGGDYTIPAPAYSYFDSRSRSYRTLRGDSYAVHVLKGNETVTIAGEGAVQSFKKEDVRVLGEDIRYIKAEPVKLTPGGVRFFGTTAYRLSLLIPLVLCVAGMLLNRRRIKANADLVRVKSKAANKMARKRLKSAAAAMRENDAPRFYQEVLTALWGYVSYKMNISASALNRDNISEHLARWQVPQETAAAFIGLLDACEFARYAPGSGSETEIENTYAESIRIITALDKACIKQPVQTKGTHTMKTLIFLCLLLAGTSGAAASIPQEEIGALPETAPQELSSDPVVLQTEAARLYQEGHYHDAAIRYKALLQQGESALLYYNLGNCYYKQEEIGHSILNYERALLLQPGNEDIRYNLEMARRATVDKIHVLPELFLVRWYKGVVTSLTADAWGILSVVLFILFLVLAVVFFHATSVTNKKLAFSTGLLALLFTALTVLFANKQYHRVTDRTAAVILTPSVTVRGAPDPSGTELFIIHEGLKVTVQDSLGSWYNVRMADGNAGWVRQSDLEKI